MCIFGASNFGPNHIWPLSACSIFHFQSLWSERWVVYLCSHPSSTHHPLKMSENAEHADKNVEIWKVRTIRNSPPTTIKKEYYHLRILQVKKLIKSLEAARGDLINIEFISCHLLLLLILWHLIWIIFGLCFKLWLIGNGTSMISLIIPPGDQACVSFHLKYLQNFIPNL